MNKDEIMKMEAGEEMDKAVAEQVMGWHIAEKGSYKYWADKDGRFECGMGRYDYEDDEDFHTLHWHPSGSILWAWEVIEILNKNFRVDVIAFMNGGVNVEIRNTNINKIIAGDNDAPSAICRAALLAMLEGK